MTLTADGCRTGRRSNEAPLPVTWVAGMGGGGQDVVLVSGNGLAGLTLGVSCSLPACGAWFTGAGGLASSLDRLRWEQLVSSAR
jgi:hypothetical protein